VKCIIDGLADTLMDENQDLLGQLILHTMHINGFPVNDIKIPLRKASYETRIHRHS
jgi:hypothetical protein